jgi:hypothetical protein
MKTPLVKKEGLYEKLGVIYFEVNYMDLVFSNLNSLAGDYASNIASFTSNNKKVIVLTAVAVVSFAAYLKNTSLQEAFRSFSNLIRREVVLITTFLTTHIATNLVLKRVFPNIAAPEKPKGLMSKVNIASFTFGAGAAAYFKGVSFQNVFEIIYKATGSALSSVQEYFSDDYISEETKQRLQEVDDDLNEFFRAQRELEEKNERKARQAADDFYARWKEIVDGAFVPFLPCKPLDSDDFAIFKPMLDIERLTSKKLDPTCFHHAKVLLTKTGTEYSDELFKSLDKVRKIFRQVSGPFHPDKNNDSKALEAFKTASVAFETIKESLNNFNPLNCKSVDYSKFKSMLDIYRLTSEELDPRCTEHAKILLTQYGSEYSEFLFSNSKKIDELFQELSSIWDPNKNIDPRAIEIIDVITVAAKTLKKNLSSRNYLRL